MTALLVKSAAILAAAELLVMLLLPHCGLTEHPAAMLLDPLLMLLLSLGPLYLLLRGERAKLEKRDLLDAKLQAILGRLWSASLHTLSADKLLDDILKEILDNSPISLQRKGAIFLVEGGELRMKAAIGLSGEQRAMCGSVPTGRCLCGAVLATGETVFASALDDRHHIRPAETAEHGHYCLPIKSSGKVIGVLTLYVEAGHRRLPEEEAFLASVCSIIARIVEGKKMERALFQVQKMDALNRFAAGIAHDFNNVLGAISGYVSVAAPGVPQGSQFASDLAGIGEAVEKGRQLTRQLALFSRQAEDKKELLDMNALVESSLGMLRRVIGPGIKLEAATAAVPLPVRCARGHLDQVLLNLAANARDAMPSGGTLRLATSREEICFVASRRCLKAARIEVSDTGEGMPESVLERLFEPFLTTKQEGKGTGLGLAMIHGIVHQHGGEIMVTSAPGAGTSFSIYLPLEEEGASEGKQAEMPEKDL